MTLLLVLSLLSLPGCKKEEPEASAAGIKGKVTLSGAWALYPMVVKWAEEYQKLYPQVIIDISAGGAGKGMADALSRAVDLGMVSREIYPPEIEKGAWWVSVVKDAVVPTFNQKNPLRDVLLKRGLVKEEFKNIWITEEVKDWGLLTEGKKGFPVHVYTRSDACGAAKTWAKYLGYDQEDLKGVGVYGDPGLAEAVRTDSLGIGFNNINYAYDHKTKLPVKGILVLPVDLNENGVIDESEMIYQSLDTITEAIANGKYPSPPARDLHLVSQGKPTNPVVVKFISWILVEGQVFVEEAGYIKLPQKKLEEQLEKLGGKLP